jgi:hypothetical protein
MGEGCRWSYYIDLKFVRSRWRFIFNLKFIFQSNFFKMASFRVHLSPGFTLGGGFPAEKFFQIALQEILLLEEIRG